jgi:uncharacterized membrane protein YfcA
MDYTETVIISALLGAVLGVVFAYSFYKFFNDNVRSSIFNGVVFLSVVGAVFFSINKDPLLTNLFYFLPVFMVVYKHVSSLVISKKEDEAREAERLENAAKQNIAREEQRLKREETEALDRKNLDRRIRNLRGD